MDNRKDQSRQELLLIPDRAGVQRYLRAGSKRKTKVRAFHINYDKVRRDSPSTALKSRVVCAENKAGTIQEKEPTKERRGNEVSQILITSVQTNPKASSQDKECDNRVMTNTEPPQNLSDRENVSPKSNLGRETSRRSPSKSIDDIAQYLRAELGDKLPQTVENLVSKTTKSEKRDIHRPVGSPSISPSSERQTREISALLKDADLAQPMLSSPLVRSRRRRMRNTDAAETGGSIKRNIKRKNQIVAKRTPVTDVSAVAAPMNNDSQSGEHVASEAGGDSVSCSGRLAPSSGEEISRGEVSIAGHETMVEADCSMRQERLMGEMTSLDVRNKQNGVKTRSFSKRKPQMDENIAGSENLNLVVGNQSLAKCSGKDRSVITSRETSDVDQSSTKVKRSDELLKKQMRDNRIPSTSKLASIRSPPNDTKHKIRDSKTPNLKTDSSISTRQRRQSNLDVEQVDREQECLEESMDPEESKKLSKLQRRLGGMSPLDRTLELLSRSRAELRASMPSLSPSVPAKKSRVSHEPVSSQRKEADGSTLQKEHKVEKGKSVKHSAAVAAAKPSKKNREITIKKKTRKGSPKMVLVSDTEEEEIDGERKELSTESEMGEDPVPAIGTSKRSITDLCDLDVVLECMQQVSKTSRTNLKNKRLKTVHDKIIDNTTDDILEMIDMTRQLKSVIASEKQTKAMVTRKRKELVELQQEHRRVLKKLSDHKRKVKSAAVDSAMEEDFQVFLKSLGNLYEAARSGSSSSS